MQGAGLSVLHGAIVARELAIPAAVNIPGILAGIGDGDTIEVNGGSGRVRLPQ